MSTFVADVGGYIIVMVYYIFIQYIAKPPLVLITVGKVNIPNPLRYISSISFLLWGKMSQQLKWSQSG